jgi:hypothetical protein
MTHAARRGILEVVREYPDSSSIEWFDFNGRARTLDVAFAGGAAYRYLGVPENVYAALRAAESKGRYVNEVVKPRYRFIRL